MLNNLFNLGVFL